MFQNRIEAGKKLAEEFDSDKLIHPLVLGLPRGGVPLAKVIANKIDAPLDVLIVKKIGLPSQPELAVGAICEGVEEPVWNPSVLNIADITKERLSPLIEEKKEEIAVDKQRYRQGKDLPNLEKRDIILADDGIPTGATFKMALQALRTKINGSRLILACPVAAKSSLEELYQYADDIVCVNAPDKLQAVGQWYKEFSPTTEKEVMEILRN